MKKTKAEMEMWSEIYEDMPDGAYFALMEERGYTADDLADLEEEEQEEEGSE